MPWRRITPALVLSVCASFTTACGDDDDAPADIEGRYTLNVTNGEDTCSLPEWDEGASFSNIPLEISQDGAEAAGTFEGVLAEVFLNVVLGSTSFEGTVEGSRLTLTRRGTNSLSQGSCAYTIKATLSAAVSGDFLEGTITYEPSTNDSPDCEGIAGCTTQQSINGSRPPQ